MLLTLTVLVRPLLRKQGSAPVGKGHDVQIYRDQLEGIGSDLARGVLSPSEAAATRSEIARRLLKAADAQAAGNPDTTLASPAIALLVALLVAVSGIGLYAQLGSPFQPGQPLVQRRAEQAALRANRPDQDMAEQDHAEAQKRNPDLARPQPDPGDLALADQLAAALATRPDDLRGHELLANSLTQLGQMAAARQAQAQVLRLKGANASGQDYLLLGEIMIGAAGGYVSPEAETALAEGLGRAPKDPRGRYFSGLALAQGGRPDLAYQLWTGLLEEGPEDAPWIAPIRAGIGEIAAAAGKPVPDINARPGPDAAALDAAGAMAPKDRDAMIRSMVEGLAARLDSDGGTAAEWAQLIRAWGVLGEVGNASAAWSTAQEIFAGDATALALLLNAAQAAQVAN